MLQPDTTAFLTNLKANNNKPWFDANRTAYDAAKTDFLGFIATVITSLERIDPTIGASQLQPKSCIFRINRDVRFSTDKSPYKPNFGAWFNSGRGAGPGKNSPSAGYYLHLEPGGSFVAGGMYMPEPTVLAAIRQEIDYDLPAFEAMLAQPAFRTYYNGLSTETKLQRPPKGYDANNPAIEYLKLKSYTAAYHLPDARLNAPDLLPTIQGAFGSLQPLVAFLNRHLADDKPA